MHKNETTEGIIKRIKKIHGDTYDCSLVEYVSMKDNIKLICKKHGVIKKSPNSLLYKVNGKYSGCKHCGRERSELAKYRSFESIIEQCKEVHSNKYDYSLIVDYVGTKHKYDFICPTHGFYVGGM